MKCALLLGMLAICSPILAKAGSFDQDFAVVFIDVQTETKYGTIPLNRGLLARGIQRIADSGAKGLVLKFFLDQPKVERDDKLLTDALSRLSSVLQARLDDNEPKSNPLPEKFILPIQLNCAASGSNGWIPLPAFAASAFDIGFVDFNSSSVPMIECYRSRSVKSLILSILELATGNKALLEPGRQIKIGSHIIKLDDKNRTIAPFDRELPLNVIPFNALLEDARPVAQMRDKIVILGYDGPHIDVVQSSIGPMGAHRLFVSILKAIYDND